MTETIQMIRGNDVVLRAYEQMRLAAAQKFADLIQEPTEDPKPEVLMKETSEKPSPRSLALEARIRKFGEPVGTVREFPIYSRNY